MPGRRLESLFVLLGISIAALSPFLALLLRERGLQADEIGVVLAIVSAAGLLTAGLVGHLADERFGLHGMLRMVIVLAAVTAAGFLVVGGNFWLVIAVAACFGAASQSMHPLVDAVALDELERRRRGDYGRVRVWASVSFAVATLGFGWLFQATSLEWLLPVYILAVLACLLPLRRSRRAVGPPVADTHRGFLTTLAAVTAVAPRFPLFLGSVLLVNVALSATTLLVPLRMDDVGSSLVLIGVGAAVAAIVEIPVMLSTGWFSRTFGARWVYLGGCLAYGLCFVAFMATDDPAIISVVWGASGVAYALVHVGSVVLVADLVPGRSRGLGQGTLQTVASGVAPIVGSLAGGALYAAFGGRTAFAAAATLAIAAGVVSWLALAGPVTDTAVPDQAETG